MKQIPLIEQAGYWADSSHSQDICEYFQWLQVFLKSIFSKGVPWSTFTTTVSSSLQCCCLKVWFGIILPVCNRHETVLQWKKLHLLNGWNSFSIQIVWSVHKPSLCQGATVNLLFPFFILEAGCLSAYWGVKLLMFKNRVNVCPPNKPQA